MQDLSFLIVEDDEFQRDALEVTLRTMGATSIQSAANGAQAILLLRAHPGLVNIVMTDLMMPGVDGIELIVALGKECPGASLVITSANERMLGVAAVMAEAHGLPVLGTLRKPITPQTLKPVLERYLPSPTRQQSK